MTDNDKHIPDQPESDRPELDDPLNTGLEADESLEADAESAAAASDTLEQAAGDHPGTRLEISEIDEDGEVHAPERPVHLERLQKILAKSGIASRRHAEELISSGRVQVNGTVITELGSKADAGRDHIRVDGKLLQGSERHRYFMLNKPKGYVTTVSDPEGRPTIMEFFSKTRERLYPVGRLDYLSEGLLLVTNDGELANKLTKAASGVEKTYLVKVSGQPTEEELDRLRQGVGIAKGKPGSDRVQTSPADIRPFRPGKPAGKRGPSRPVDNPWFEVVLIEGRNRELRKMFEEIGHHVEKIRRVGYGPLILDLEPGKIRELEAEEVENLRKAAEGKYRKPKLREPRKREFTPRPERSASKPGWNKRPADGRSSASGTGEARPFRANDRGFEQRSESGGPRRPEAGQFRRDTSSAPRRDAGRAAGGEAPREFRPAAGRTNPRLEVNRPQRPQRRDDREIRPYTGARENRGRSVENRPFKQENGPKRFGARPPRRDLGAPAPSQGDHREARPRFEGRPPQRAGGARTFGGDRSSGREDRPRFDRPRTEGSGSRNRESGPPRQGPGRPPRQDRAPDRENRPRFDSPRAEGRPPRREPRSERPEARPERGRPERSPEQRSGAPRSSGSFRPGKPDATGGRQGGVRSGSGGRTNSRASGSRPTGSRPSGSRSTASRPGGSRPSGKRPSGSRGPGSRPSGSRPSSRGPNKRRP
jgi:23S rRNA pseudouridine2605 synthase